MPAVSLTVTFHMCCLWLYVGRTEGTITFSQKDFLPDPPPRQCGYDACDLGKEGMLNVHLVPHTHDDVGWLKTVDQYYYGSKNVIQHAGVQYILDSVIEQLAKDKNRRFIYVEIAFFYRWWNQQNNETKNIVKMLVNQGRLEFILGGWSMNDEGATHYNAIIDQHTLGFKFLRENFGDCARPRIGWQIDPFGHSREQASLFAQFGFDGLFFGRLDYQDKEKRLKRKTMELMWMASDNLGDQASLFTSINYNQYDPPAGFCFDSGCADPPIMDDPRLHDYNVPERVAAFVGAAQDQAKHFTTNHIMMTMGSDFQYENARENYKNLDKLIKYVNAFSAQNKTGINLLYSTPSCYVYAVNKAGQTYSTKQDDFFPYAFKAHTFFTGFLTSRPALKGYVRYSNNFLQVCKQLSVLARLEDQSDARVDVLRRALGVAQHHDAVSGTEKQAVADDYAQRLAKGIQSCRGVVQEAFTKLLQKSSEPAPLQQFCPLLNASECFVTDSCKQFTVTVYNPLARAQSWWVRVPVAGRYHVLDSLVNPVPAQTVPLTDATKRLPEHRGSPSVADLIFEASLPPLGFNTYFVQSDNSMKYTQTNLEKSVTQDLVIENAYVGLSFNGNTGLLQSMTSKESKFQINIEQSLMYYKSYGGNLLDQSSGAYIFRPNGSEPIVISKSPKTTYVKGDLVQEVRQEYAEWASQVYRLYKDERYVEVEWTVGPIPVADKIGKEVITKFMTDLDTNGEFFTDANGREVLKRKRDYRPTWKLNQTEPVAGNYFPVNSRIYIQDRNKSVQLTVMTDRSHGGGSIRDGEMEIMLHRRLLHDDYFGVDEALNETGITGKGLVVRGKFYILLTTIENSASLHRHMGERLYMAPSLTFSNLTVPIQHYTDHWRTTWGGLQNALPQNVHLLTLEKLGAGSVLLRLEHFFEKSEDPLLSRPATVNLDQLFDAFKILSVEELTLGANAKLSEVKRLQWKTKSGTTETNMESFVVPVSNAPRQVILHPMQIRTFQVHLLPTKDNDI